MTNLRSEGLRREVADAQRKGDMGRLASLLDDAVNRAEVEEVAMLLDAGVSSGLRDVVGDTPLINAAWVGAPALVKLLLIRGADPNEQGANGETALDRVRLIPQSQQRDDHRQVIALLEQAASSPKGRPTKE